MLTFSAILSLVIAGCGGSEPPQMSEAQRNELWIDKMQSELAATLKDPKSATFRGSRVSRKGGLPAVCGEVNSKNSFGGMTGFQRFIAAGSIKVVEEQMGKGEMAKLWTQFCG